MLRKKIIYLIELVTIFIKYWREYIAYYLYRKRKLYKLLREAGYRQIKVVQPCEWKVHYGSYYFRAVLNNNTVFIKVTSSFTKDGYINEVICNDYIQNKSEFLIERTPKILDYFMYEDFYVIVFEYFEIRKDINIGQLKYAVCEFIDEYSKIGIIHQDLKPSNVTIHNGKYCVIDYGYSICPNSNHIRIAKGNYIESISDRAKAILEDADFYYDDVVASGIEGIDRNSINFIVGRKDKYFINLAENIFEYRVEQLAGRSVFLLHKYSALDNEN